MNKWQILVFIEFLESVPTFVEMGLVHGTWSSVKCKWRLEELNCTSNLVVLLLRDIFPDEVESFGVKVVKWCVKVRI